MSDYVVVQFPSTARAVVRAWRLPALEVVRGEPADALVAQLSRPAAVGAAVLWPRAPVALKRCEVAGRPAVLVVAGSTAGEAEARVFLAGHAHQEP